MLKYILIASVVFLIMNYKASASSATNEILKLNTSNQGKFEEFKRLFAGYSYDLEVTQIDLKEIDADPIAVVAHKASQVGEGIIIEDTSLEIEGASVGVNIRWLLDNLSEYAGRKATWVVLLAYQSEGRVLIYEGKVTGIIVDAQGAAGFGFDPVFLPDGATETLAQSKPDEYNARAKAVKALIENDLFAEHDLIEEWDGPWQHD